MPNKSNIFHRVQRGEGFSRTIHSSGPRRAETEVHFDKPEPDTFWSQRRHPVHHFINFVKFSTFGASLIYLGNQVVQKIGGTTES